MAIIATTVPAQAPEVWATPAKVDAEHRSNTVVQVRYPDGQVYPVAAGEGQTARQIAAALAPLESEGYTVLRAVKVGACGTRAFSSPA